MLFYPRWIAACAAGELVGIGAATAAALAINGLIGEPSSTAARLLTLAAFAAVGAFLAAIGLYGVVSYVANRRAREIAIRLALGAGRSSILRAIGGRYLTASAAGVIGGLVGSTLAAGLIRRFLFGIQAQDPATLAGVAVMLVAVAAIAAWLPVRRTLRADPMRSLKYE